MSLAHVRGCEALFSAQMFALRRAHSCYAVFSVRLFRLRTALAWAGNLTIWACGCWVAIAYGRCMGRKSTELLLIGWATGCGISWCIMEPAWIFLIIFAPCLCNNKIMNTINDRLNDLGLDLSLLA
eukprot:4636923-Pleurochrysis_carterae.AAC.2